MKRFITSKRFFLPLLVLFGSLLAVALRIWTCGDGPNGAGLFEPRPLAWTLLWILTAAVTGICLVMLRGMKNPGTYRDNYPRSVMAGLCAVPAALSFLVSGYFQLRDAVALSLPGTTAVDTVTGIFALIAGLCLLFSAAQRFVGKRPFFLVNGLVCLYLALRLFNRCRIWSNEPQMGTVVFPFLASTALMLSAYYRVRFDVNLGDRSKSAFWSLMSVYLCVVAIVSFEQPLFYGMCALWQMVDLCSLRPLKRRPQVETCEVTKPESVQEPEAPEENA